VELNHFERKLLSPALFNPPLKQSTEEDQWHLALSNSIIISFA